MPERPFLIATARLSTHSIPTTFSPVSWDDPFGLQPAPESPRNRVKSARKSLVFKDSWDDFRLPAGFDPPNLLKLRHFAGSGGVSRTSPRSSQETHARRATDRLHDVRIAVVGFLPIPNSRESLVQAAHQLLWRSETAKVATSHIFASAVNADLAMPFIDDPNGTTAQRSAKPKRASASSLSKEPPPAFRSSGGYSPPQKTSEIRRKDEATRRSSFPAGRALARSPEGVENFRDHLVAATQRLLPDREGFSRDAERPEISATPFCRAPNTSEEGKSLRRTRPTLRKFRERLFRCPRELRRIAKGLGHSAQVLRNFRDGFHRPENRPEFRAKRGATWHKAAPARAKRGVTRHTPSPVRAIRHATRHTVSPARAKCSATRHTVSPARAKCGATRQAVSPARAKPGVTRHKPAPARANRGATWHTVAPARANRGATRHTVAPGRARCGATYVTRW
jgi:hypothetical protein